MDVFRRFSKLFGKCLPSRKGKGKEDTVIDSHGEDPLNTRTLVDGEIKKDVSETPVAGDFPEKGCEGAHSTAEEPDLNTTFEDVILKPQIESNDFNEGKEVESFTDETLKVEKESSAKSEVSNVGVAIETVDPQDEDYKWEVSCCGVDIPMSK